MDEHWVRCRPYEQDVGVGEEVHLRIEFTNHSAVAQPAHCRPVLPNAWGQELPVRAVLIPPQADGFIDFTIVIPAHAAAVRAGNQAQPKAQRLVIPIEIDYAGRALGQFREAIFVLGPVS